MPTAYANRGWAYNDKGDYDRAIADFDRAIQLKPDYAEAYANRGWAYNNKGDYDRAIADFDRAIQLKPDYALAYANRGLAYNDKGDYDRAIADLKIAAGLIPASDPVRAEVLQRLAALESKPAGETTPNRSAGIGRVDGDPTPIFVTGALKAGSYEEFADQIIGLQNVLVVFDSEGGNLVEALEMGRKIRLRGFSTVVPEGAMCASACALAWLAGQKRFIASDAKVGFHAAYELEGEAPPVETGSGNALVGAYLNDLGFSGEAIYYFTSAPPESMNWLTPEKAVELGISVEPWTALSLDEMTKQSDEGQ